LCLTGPAKPYGIGQDVDDILEALRARFGLTAWDARVQMQGLRRNPKTNLREHATVVERLAQVAYGDLPADRVWHWMHSSSLLTTSGKTASVGGRGWDYWESSKAWECLFSQVDSTCRPGTAIQQVEADDDVSTSPADSCTFRHGSSQRTN